MNTEKWLLSPFCQSKPAQWSERNLTKKYGGLTAVDNLKLQIERDELFALLGTNGAGKTTIKMLSCLIPPTNGDAILLNNSIYRHYLSVCNYHLSQKNKEGLI